MEDQYMRAVSNNNPEEKRKRPPREWNQYSDVFWTNVEEIMNMRQLRWTDLSYVLGTDRTTVASMRTRRSRLTLDTVMKVSEALRIPIQDLVTKHNEPQFFYEYRLAVTQQEDQMLSEYLRIRNTNPEKADTAFKIIMNILREFQDGK